MGKSAWVLRAIESLNSSGSWTGRTHVHKLLFVAKQLGGADVPFSYELYQYGPYSYELDSTIRDLQGVGLLEPVARAPGYGPSYIATEGWTRLLSGRGDLGDRQTKILNDVAASFGDMSSSDLEVVATCLWVEDVEGVRSEDGIVDRVRELKPRYKSPFIKSKLQDLRAIRSKLSSQ